MCRDFIGSIVNGDKIDGLFCISCSGKSWERCSINTILYELNSLFNIIVVFLFFFFKQKQAYERRISDWSSDVCSSDLLLGGVEFFELGRVGDSLHRGDHLIGRLFQLGGQLVLAVAAFLRIRRRTIFRRSGAACARDRGGIQVAARGSGAGTLSGRERAKVRGGDSGTPAKPRRRFFFDLRAFLGRLLAEFANATGGRDRKSTRLNSSH